MTAADLVVILSTALISNTFVVAGYFLWRSKRHAVAHRLYWLRHHWQVDPVDRDFLRLCYVTLLVAMWLRGW